MPEPCFTSSLWLGSAGFWMGSFHMGGMMLAAIVMGGCGASVVEGAGGGEYHSTHQ